MNSRVALKMAPAILVILLLVVWVSGPSRAQEDMTDRLLVALIASDGPAMPSPAETQRPTPTTTQPKWVEELIDDCPTTEQIAAINQQLDLLFETDPSSGMTARSAENDSANLTPTRRRVYMSLIVAQHLEFTDPLPWTELKLYNWLANSIEGIRFRDDIQNSFCCGPPGYINIRTTPSTFHSFSDRWWDPATGVGGVSGAHPGLVRP